MNNALPFKMSVNACVGNLPGVPRTVSKAATQGRKQRCQEQLAAQEPRRKSSQGSPLHSEGQRRCRRGEARRGGLQGTSPRPSTKMAEPAVSPEAGGRGGGGEKKRVPGRVLVAPKPGGPQGGVGGAPSGRTCPSQACGRGRASPNQGEAAKDTPNL